MTITYMVILRETFKVFADIFYWFALTDSADAAHKRARLVTDDLVTTDEVLTEYLARLR
jgi:hypothetical protein